MVTTTAVSFALLVIAVISFSYNIIFLHAQEPTACVCKSELPARIDATLKDVPEHWSLYIEELSKETSAVVYDRHSHQFSIPASNTKLLTTITAWSTYGPHYQIKTSFILYDNNQRLCVIGRGDPTINSTHLAAMAVEIASLKVKYLKEVVYDDSYFDNAIPDTWEWGDLGTDDGAHPGTFVLNQNTMTITVSPASVGDLVRVFVPQADLKFFKYENRAITVGKNQKAEGINVYYNFGSGSLQIDGSLGVDEAPQTVRFAVVNTTAYFQNEFNWFLKANGIKVDNTSVRACNQTAMKDSNAIILSIKSPPLGTIIEQCLLESNNLFAETLLRHLGKWNPKLFASAPSSAEKGIATMREVLPKFGVNNSWWYFLDGSGISRQNIVTPKALVTLLTAIYRFQMNDYISCLPVAGRSGTLENRFKGTPAEGVVHAKTGTLNGVVALSGYVLRSNYNPIVFSIVVNNSDKSATYLRSVLDTIVVWLAQLCPC